MTCATPCGCAPVRCPRFGARRRRARTGFPRPTATAIPVWPSSCSGKGWRTCSRWHPLYPVELRRVTARVEVDGELRELVFLTNNVTWSAQTVADRCRWSSEVFFKELKQTLPLADFLGHNANAVRWQVWTALLVYLLLRFGACRSQWGHSLPRRFARIRSALWQKLELASRLECDGTASGGGRFLGTPQQAYLPGYG